jgi:opacity protein-like surface antigen
MQRIIVVLLCLFSANLWADRYYRDDRENSGSSNFYIGGAIASSELNDDGMSHNQSLGNTTGSLHLFGGYQFDRTFAVELGMDWLGDYTMRSPVSNIEADYSTVTMSVVGKVPLDQEFFLYGQLGMGVVSLYQHVNVDNGTQWVYGDDNDSNWAGVWGVGFGFIPRQTQQLELRLGFQQTVFQINAYSIDNAGFLTRDRYSQDVRQGYIGAAWHF